MCAGGGINNLSIRQKTSSKFFNPIYILIVSFALAVSGFACGGSDKDDPEPENDAGIVVTDGGSIDADAGDDAGADDEECAPGRFGENCDICTCQNGICNDGKKGNGQCLSCLENTGWSGANCDECTKEGYYGKRCRDVCPGGIDNICSGNGECNDGINGDGTCSCTENADSTDCSGCPGNKTNAPACDRCVANYFGADCESECPKTANGYCNGSGTCNSSGACECDVGWTGTYCGQCASGYYGFGIVRGCNECVKGSSSYHAGICSYKDKRNGTIYPVYKINGKFWLGKNMDYKTGATRYPNGDSANVKKYGLLYYWETAKTICPDPWRLPTKDEFQGLLDSSGYDPDETLHETAAANLRAREWKDGHGQNGNDIHGFGALPAGYYDYNKGSGPSSFGKATAFWSGTTGSSNENYLYYLIFPEPYWITLSSGTILSGQNYPYPAYSVRCVTDVIAGEY